MAAAERAGWGRGARRSESARAGGGSEPGAQPGKREEPGSSAEPAARDMAKAGRAGEGGRAPEGRAEARGRDPRGRGGLPVQVKRSRRWAEVPAGAGGGGEARPRRVQKGLGAPRVLPVPTVTSWDTASPSPRPRWEGPGLRRPVQPGCGRPDHLPDDPAGPGAGPPLHPLLPKPGRPPRPATRYLQDATVPRPQPGLGFFLARGLPHAAS